MTKPSNRGSGLGNNPRGNLIEVSYRQTGESVNTDRFGMREMQRKVYAERTAQYLLVKAPPASGKSRALMFVGLDKLYNQGLKKVIVAAPERSIGQSFATTKLTDFGFWADWEISPENNLCTPGSTKSKVREFLRFMDSSDSIMICTHATLRFAFGQLSPSDFDDCVLAIDEFHHVSADPDSSRLGAVLAELMSGSRAHIVAMTGSYFRGDSVPVLLPQIEGLFTPVTFNYYDQLNGYRYLTSLGIGHHFYQGRWYDALHEVLDLEQKTILHIPNVNSGESTKDKIEEVGRVIDVIGKPIDTDATTGILRIQHRDSGETLLVADLVDDTDPIRRGKTLAYLTEVASKDPNAVDIIIALGMAKEGFDWPFAEHALTVGYRASLTEIIQIIGRVTRDSEGKSHAQFTNLIAQPDASNDEVTVAVNNMLKAITASLLMEQVLAPNFNFKTRRGNDDFPEPGQLLIKGFKEPSSSRVKQIVQTDLNDLKATILHDNAFAKAAVGGLDPQVANQVLIPKIIRERYPDLNDLQVEELRQQVVVDSVIKNGEVKQVGDDRFIRMQDKFINVNELNINLIDSVNPFQRAFEVLSKSVTAAVLRVIQETIAANKIEVTTEEAEIVWPKIENFRKLHGRAPEMRSDDPEEKRLGEVLVWMRKRAAELRAQSAPGSDESEIKGG